MAGFRASIAAVLLLALAACSGPRPTGRVSRPFDRETDSIAVYQAVLATLRRPETTRFVVSPQHRGGGVDESFVRERIRAVRGDTLADFRSRPQGGAMPRALAPGLPLEWFSEADWKALPTGLADANGEMEARWQAFHARFPGSAGWIEFSPVGFSRDGREALVHVSKGFASLGGAGEFVLLRRGPAGWAVVDRARTWVA